MPCLERAHAEREAEQVRRLAVVEKPALVDGRVADEHGDDDDDTITVSRVGYSPNAATASSGPMITSRFISIATCVAGMCRVANTMETSSCGLVVMQVKEGVGAQAAIHKGVGTCLGKGAGGSHCQCC